MTTATEHLPAPQGGIRQSISDSLVITGRNLRRIPRIPELAIFAIIQSIMFVLLFAFVFGGAIPLAGYSGTERLPRVPAARHLRPDHRLRRGHRGDRHVRRHQQGHHRPLPLAADGPLGRAHRPDVLGSRLQRRDPRRADAGRPGRRLVASTRTSSASWPAWACSSPSPSRWPGSASGSAWSCRPWRWRSRSRSPCSSRSRSSRACSCPSRRCRTGCSPSPTGTR